MTQNELLDLFRQTGALLRGHFVLRSGLHSREFFQCALLLRDTKVAERVCAALAEQLRGVDCDAIISPALGGILVGQEVARQLGKPHIFVEKNDNGALVLRRGFQINPGEKFTVIEDVVTRGGRLMETVDIVKKHSGVVAAAACLVNRSGGQLPAMDFPFYGLVELNPETFPPDALPPDLASIPAIKQGGASRERVKYRLRRRAPSRDIQRRWISSNSMTTGLSLSSFRKRVTLRCREAACS